MSDCACLYGNDDADAPTFYSEGFVTARKAHVCVECQRPIAPGERYRYMTGKWDGDMRTYRTCAACHDIRESLYCDGWYFGGLWEDITEQIFREGGLTVACVDKLTDQRAKAYLQRRWMEFLGVEAEG